MRTSLIIRKILILGGSLALLCSPMAAYATTVDEVLAQVDQYFADGSIADAATRDALRRILNDAKNNVANPSAYGDFVDAFLLSVATMWGETIADNSAVQLMDMGAGL